MPTATLEIHRDDILRRLGQGRSYDYLALALPYLDACPGDTYLRLMTAREFLRLGLVAPARDLLEEPGAEIAHQELASLQEAVAKLPSGRILWKCHETIFAANLSALAARGVNVHSLHKTWTEDASEFELFRDTNGQFQVRRRQSDGRWEWIPALRHHEKTESAEPLPDGIGGMTPGPYLFEGAGTGLFFHRVLNATANTFHGFSCAMYLVEEDAATFAAALHLQDWTTTLGQARVLPFLGKSWIEDLHRRWRSEPNLPLPRTVLTLGPRRNPLAPTAAIVVQEAQQGRETEIVRSFADIEARYAQRDRRFWANRYDEARSGRGAPLRILAAVSTHTTFLQYSMRDARRAFEALGHQCTVLTENTPYEIISPLSYHRAIRELDPDVFFIIDHLRPEFSYLVPRNLPILTWDQDQLPQVITTDNLRQLAPHDFVVGCSKPQAVRLGADRRQFRYTQMPTCPEQFGGPPLTCDEVQRFDCDVSYVSHASQTPREFHEQERTVWLEIGLCGLLDTLYELLPARMPSHGTPTGAVVGEILSEGMRRCGISSLAPDVEARLRGWYLWRLGDRVFRHQALEWVADWAKRNKRSLRIYGNGWNQHPTLAEFAAGSVQNGRELLCVHRASRINLQLMPAGFLHQRALDGVAAGGFFLTRETAGDFAAPILRRVLDKCHELGISTTSELLARPDHELSALLAAIREQKLHSVDASADRLLDEISINLEVSYPSEIFPSFREIVFGDPNAFDRVATRFLHDADARRRIADEMRTIIIERFSYRTAIDGFLREMADYLRDINPARATATPSPQAQ